MALDGKSYVVESMCISIFKVHGYFATIWSVWQVFFHGFSGAAAVHAKTSGFPEVFL